MEKREWAEITRPTAVVFREVADTARSLYETDRELALEYLMSSLELFFADGMTTDNFIVKELLRPYGNAVNRSRDLYETKLENKKAKKAEVRQYSRIAALYKEKATQAQIGAELGISQQQVSRYLADIKENYPELL